MAVDNFFTTLPPVDKLTGIGMYGLGTIRESRLQGASLKKEAALKIKTGQYYYTSDRLYIWWKQFAHLMEAICFAWRLFHKIYGNNIPLLTFLCELVLETLGNYGRNRPVQSLNTSEIARTSKRLEILNHVVVKAESKYCRCQQCGRRTIFKSGKCKASLHPECIKLYHQ